ncbi:MAG: diguanylate cyclase [Kineosporiaceae bacterium]
MRWTGSAPDGAAATIAALPEQGRTAVVVVLAVVALGCVLAAVAGLTWLLSEPRRRHGAARSTFYLAAMPSPLAAPGRHRHRRRSTLVQWTAWPNPLRPRPAGPALEDAELPVARLGANPAGRQITPDRSRSRRRQRAERAARAVQAAAVDLPAVLEVAPPEAPADTAPAEPAPSPMRGPRRGAAARRRAAAAAVRRDEHHAPAREGGPDDARDALAVAARAAFSSADTPSELRRRLAEHALDVGDAAAAAVVLQLPDGVRVASVADRAWPLVDSGEGARRRGCDPEQAASAVGWWRGLLESWAAGRVEIRPGSSATPGRRLPWAGGGAVRGVVADAQGRPRAAIAVPVRLGARAVGALVLVRDPGRVFTGREQQALAAVVAPAAAALALSAPRRGDDEPGSAAELLGELGDLLPRAALPGWAPVVVSLHLRTAGGATSGSLERAVTEGLRQVLREEDRVYRWGPRELVVLCPDLPRARVRTVVERIRRCAAAVLEHAPAPAGADGATVDLGWAVARQRSAVKLVAAARSDRAARIARTGRPEGTDGTPGGESTDAPIADAGPVEDPEPGQPQAPTSAVPAPRVSSDRVRQRQGRAAG